MSKKYARTKSDNQNKDKISILTPAAVRARSKAIPGTQKEQDEDAEQAQSSEEKTTSELKSIFYYRHHQSQRFEKKVEDGDSYM